MSELNSNLEKLSNLILAMQENDTINQKGRKAKRKAMREYNHLSFKVGQQIRKQLKNQNKTV